MLRNDRPRLVPRLLALVFGLVAAAGHAAATEITAVTPPQQRYFTIKAVLAEHDGLRVATGPVELASADPASSEGRDSDAPSLSAMVSPSDEPFGLMTFRAPDGVLGTKWRTITAALSADARAVAACKRDDDRCAPVERLFAALTRAARDAQGSRLRAEIVNRSVNQAVRYVSDLQQHGVADFWSPPLRTLRSGIGDCEDYAILKYAVLIAAGAAESDVKLLLVHDSAAGQDHAVLAARLDGRWMVLDNRRSALLEGRALQSMTPLFALDERGVSLFAAPHTGRPDHERGTDVEPAAQLAPLGGVGSSLPPML